MCNRVGSRQACKLHRVFEKMGLAASSAKACASGFKNRLSPPPPPKKSRSGASWWLLVGFLLLPVLVVVIEAWRYGRKWNELENQAPQTKEDQAQTPKVDEPNATGGSAAKQG